MKGFFRSMSAMLLIVLFSVFCLWRYEKLTVVSDVTAYFGAAFDRFERLMALAEPKGEEDEPPTTPFDPDSDYTDYDPTVTVDATLEETLRAGLDTLAAEIDLTALSPTKDAVKNAMSAIIYSSPEYFYLKSGYSISFEGDTVRAITPAYSVTPEEVAVMRETYQAKLAEIVAGAPQSGTDFDKILYLHDYFVANYSYDSTLTIRDAYTFFTQKTGVCQAYMLGLIAAARELGIESIPVTSDAMKHAWNLVKIEGAWYHVDITWDDTRSSPTLTCYTYFLQSDAGLIAIDAARKEGDRHRDWSTAAAATDTRYDAAVFRTSNTPILKHDGVYYCTTGTQKTSANLRGEIWSGADVTAMTHFLDITGGYWSAGGKRFYTDCYAGLAVADGYLYYNSGNSINRVSLNDPAADYKVYLVTGLAEDESVYGLLGMEGDTISYLKAVTLTATEYTVDTQHITH